MGEFFDSQAAVDAVEAALVGAEPFAAVPLLVGQVPFLEPEAAVDLLRRIVLQVHPGTWGFEDEVMKRWPAEAVAFALEQIRALPSVPLRIEALCYVASCLTLSEKREVLDGILDETLPRLHPEHPGISNSQLIARFVRTLPEEWQEEWIRAWALDDDGAPNVFDEYSARCDVDRLAESNIRDMWSRIDHSSESPHDIPEDYFWLASILPADLRMRALERIRACKDQDTRLHHLVDFDEELTTEERRELVEVVPNEYIREEPWAQADHLRSVAHHLPKVAEDLRHRWLEAVLSFDTDYRQWGLVALLPVLSTPKLESAKEALVSAFIAEGGFVTNDCRWELIPDEVFAPLVYRLRDDECGWRRDQAIKHIVEERDEALVERCLTPLLESLPSLSKDACLEAMLAMTPWLAKVTDGSIPLAIGSLAIPNALTPANPGYWRERVSDD